jgi:transposase
MSTNDASVPVPEPNVPEEGRNPSATPGSFEELPNSMDGPDPVEPITDDDQDIPPPDDSPGPNEWASTGALRARQQGKRLVLPADKPTEITPQQRLLLLDIWQRSGLPARDFAVLVGISRHTLYAWKKRFDTEGPAGLLDRPRRGTGSHLPDLTKRTILLLKQSNPEWGCQRISDMLQRGPALPASPSAVARVLREAGYQLEDVPTRPHAPPVRRFERAQPNQLWQTDLFTFVLKRQNRRVGEAQESHARWRHRNSSFDKSAGIYRQGGARRDPVLEALDSGDSLPGVDHPFALRTEHFGLPESSPVCLLRGAGLLQFAGDRERRAAWHSWRGRHREKVVELLYDGRDQRGVSRHDDRLATENMEVYQTMKPAQLTATLRRWAQGIDLGNYRKSPRGPKKPRPARPNAQVSPCFHQTITRTTDRLTFRHLQRAGWKA